MLGVYYNLLLGGWQMEQDIMQIIEVDLIAQKRIKEAEDKMQEGLLKTKSEKPIIQENVWNSAKIYIEAERKRLEEALSTSTNANMQKYEKNLENLESSFNRKKTGWVEEIFRNCINEK